MRVILAAAACFELCAAQPWWNCQIVNENDAGHVCFVSDDSGNLFISHGLQTIWYDYSIDSEWQNMVIESEGENTHTSTDANGYMWNVIAWNQDGMLRFMDASSYNLTVDSNSTGNTSVAMAEFNMPGIAYSGDNGVMFSMRQEFDWRIDSVDSGCTGAEVSLVFDLLDLPRIAYCDDSSLNYAAYDGNQWIVTEIDSEGEFACSGITLELDDSDKPWIACRKNDDLCLYHHDGSVWSSEVLAEGRCTETSRATMAFDEGGALHVAYNALDSDTGLYWITYLTSSEGWQEEALWQGSCPSLGIDGFNYPVIAFVSEPDSAVRFLGHYLAGVPVNPSEGENTGMVHPNPASVSACMEVTLSEPGDAEVFLMDISGRIVLRKTFSGLPNGESTLEIELAEIPPDYTFAGYPH